MNQDLFVEVITTADVAEVWLSRPEALNAINSAMAQQLVSTRAFAAHRAQQWAEN